MKRRRAFQAALAVATLTLGTAQTAEAQGVDGMYAFEVLSADGVSVIAVGRFVLSSTPFDLDLLPKDLADARLRRSSYMLGREGRMPRVCFGFEKSHREVGGREFYGGIIHAGLSDWTEENGMITLQVYESPDASQYLSGALTRHGLEGRVLQHDVVMIENPGPVEWLPFKAERVDEASIANCEAVLRTERTPRGVASQSIKRLLPPVSGTP